MLTSELTTIIDRELRWRESELALAKINLQRSIGQQDHFRFAYRCFVAMTYAHYEAYSKRVIAQAMNDIFRSGQPWSKCQVAIRSNLIAPGLRKMMHGLSNEELAQYSSSDICLLDRAPAPSLDIILDCGNLNVTNFFWAIESLGLDISRFSTYRGDIGRLVNLRHECAHGEELTFDPLKTLEQLARDIFHLQSKITTLMHLLAVEIIDHFRSSSYLAA